MAGLASLSKSRAKRVMGIDASTKSIAFTIFYNRRPVHFGKVDIEGSDIYAKIGDANRKIYALYKLYEIDYIAIEGAAFINSPKVAVQLAYVYGSIIGVLVALGCETITVPAMTWQSFIDNPPFKKADKDKLKALYPDKSASWYQNMARQIRKKRTLDYFNKKFKLSLIDDDVADSMGISYYAYYQLTRRN